MKKSSYQSTGLWIAGVIILVTAVFVVAKWNTAKTYSTKTNREIALGCTSDSATLFHIHAEIEININGRAVEVPANTGISSACMNALHTHDASGTIHVEAPEQRDFTLGDFFAVWGKLFTQDQILDNRVDATHVIRMTVNGEESKEFENLVLRDDDQIIIYYDEQK